MMKKKLETILLVDDDLATNVYNAAIVKQAEVTDDIKVHDSGKSALSYLTTAENGSFPNPALIFLDVNMPGMDGWDFLEEYHKLAKIQKEHVVIFMLTTSLDPNDESKSLNMGAKGFIRKPLTPELIRKIAQEHFPQNF